MNHKTGAVNRVFVYGTLMTGQPANHYLDGGTCLGRYVLQNYAMYHLGSYPGILPQAGESVLGEVYEIPESLWAQMDEYEGEGSLYHRRHVTVEQDGKPLEVQVYIYARSVEGCPLMREPWDHANPF